MPHEAGDYAHCSARIATQKKVALFIALSGIMFRRVRQYPIGRLAHRTESCLHKLSGEKQRGKPNERH